MRDPWDKTELILGLIAGLISLLCYFGGISSEFKATPDSCEYLGLAQSLAEGEGYHFNGQDGSRYPPLLPGVLACLVLFSRWTSSVVSVVVLAKIVQVILAFLMALGAGRLALCYLERRWAYLIGLLVWANLLVFQHCQFILSDVWYGCLSVWGLVLFCSKGSGRHLIPAVFLLSLGWLTRTVGMLLALGLLAGLLWGRPVRFKGKLRWILIFLGPGFCALPFVVWNVFWSGQEGGFYLNVWRTSTGQSNLPMAMLVCFPDMAPRVVVNSMQVILNIETMKLPLYFSLIGFALLVWGWWIHFSQRRGVVEWYVLFYMGLMSVWFSDQGVRFYLPLLPMLLVYGITALMRLTAPAAQQGRWFGVIRVIIVAALVVMVLPLVQYWYGRENSISVLGLIRNGYLYCVGAGVFLLVALGKQVLQLHRISPVKVAGPGYLLIYLVIGWLYGAGYMVLEHGVVKSRGPMLAGYEPYRQMGAWLKEQDRFNGVVLSGQSAMVHWSSGRIIREPEREPELTWERLKHGDYTQVLYLDYANEDRQSVDEYNEQIRGLVEKYPDSFELEAEQSGDFRFHLYRFVYPVSSSGKRRNGFSLPDRGRGQVSRE